MSSQMPPHDADPAVPDEMSRTKKIVWMAIVLAVVLVTVLIVHRRIVSHRGGSGFVNQAARAGFAAPLSVGVAQVTRGDVPITIDSLGTVTPLATVTVHPQVTGPLVKIAFSEGQQVKKGDLLAEIDPRPFQATVDQDQAQLQHDQALLNNAKVDLARYKVLVAQNSVAEQTYATQQATVLQDQATLAADQAALASAKLNLSYCRITAPVDGSVGLRQVDVGNVVSAYSSTIAVVTQLHPMSVLFTIPEDDLSRVVARVRQKDKLQAVAYDRTFTTELDSGVLTDIDNQVDPTTGTLKLRAMFNNMALQLFPQQFVNVRLTLQTLQNQILVPGAAVQTGNAGSYVYVVDPGPAPAAAFDPPGAPASGASGAAGRRGRNGGNRRFGGAGDFGAGGPAGPVRAVHLRPVTTGPSVGNLISISSGLSVGETVVVDGAEQLKDGALVTTPGIDQPGAAGPGAAPQSSSQGPGTPPASGASAGGTAGHGGGARAHSGAGPHRPEAPSPAAPGPAPGAQQAPQR